MSEDAVAAGDLATKGIDVVYRSPEIAHQRLQTIKSLRLKAGDHVADLGCGNGLLTELMARAVGAMGRVEALDLKAEMLTAAQATCTGLEQVVWHQGRVNELPLADASLDALACTQVLLYVEDVEGALVEMRRVLKPGGRIAVLETDWRGVVLNSSDDALTRRIFAAWDATASSPNLPCHLGTMLRAQGFDAIGVEAIPIVNSHFMAGNFSTGMLSDLAALARKREAISEAEEAAFIAEMQDLERQGAYFFCVNRFLFSAVKS